MRSELGSILAVLLGGRDDPGAIAEAAWSWDLSVLLKTAVGLQEQSGSELVPLGDLKQEPKS